jgi:fatty-acyl-CoA synthase
MPTESTSALKAWTRALARTAPIAGAPHRSFPIVIDELAHSFEAAPALVTDESTLSFRGLSDRAGQVTRWALARGLQPADVVCLLLPNCPEYLAIWLGLTRAGIAVSLLNTNLRGAALVHSIRIVAPRALIVADSMLGFVREIRSEIDVSVDVLSFSLDLPSPGRKAGAGEDVESLSDAIAGLDPGPLTAHECPPPSLEDLALYIYTSGTTGMPKAARVSHYRVMQWSHWFAGLLDTTPEDRMYNCLPLYHSVGGVVATGATLLGGGAVILRRRFSAGEFWSDIAAHRCTLFQYIGELCRYLVHQPAHPRETRHSLRAACGNGLRPEVWAEFQRRFHIPRILEYYAATEGSFSLYNCEGKVGAVGRIPPFLAHRMPVALVQFDAASGLPVRDDAGRCIASGVDEPGEAIGKIAAPGKASGGRFEGYADSQASAQKILRDVFVPGDAWYRTGDLMRRDNEGFYYFVDRVGDTYRWKGENVSSAEVTAALLQCRGIGDAVVYGVAIPGADGRAGMAALVVTPDFDAENFRHEIAARLPEYARPLFLRFLPAIATTGTFKPQKHELAVQGFDPDAISDVLLFDDRKGAGYVRVDAELFRRICDGAVRL